MPRGPLDGLCGPPVDCPSGVTLFRQDELPRTVFLVSRGLVKQVRTDADGREAIVALRAVVSLVGSSSAISGDSHVTTASTLIASTLQMIEAAALRRALEFDWAVSRFVHQMHAREVREQFLRAGEAMLPAIRRLERLLAGFVRDGLTAKWNGQIRLNVPLSHEEIGQMIAVSREHVTRLLGQLAAQGLIERREDRILITPQSRLLGLRSAAK